MIEGDAQTLLPLFQWLEDSWLSEVIQQSNWLFPVIMSIHLVAFAGLGGAILLVDLRLLGAILRSEPVKQLAHSVRWLLYGSLAVMFVTGFSLFVSEAIKCYFNDPFWIKMRCLGLGMVFTFTVRRKLISMEPGRVKAIWLKVAALINIGLWSGVAWGGRWIGFWG